MNLKTYGTSTAVQDRGTHLLVPLAYHSGMEWLQRVSVFVFKYATLFMRHERNFQSGNFPNTVVGYQKTTAKIVLWDEWRLVNFQAQVPRDHLDGA